MLRIRTTLQSCAVAAFLAAALPSATHAAISPATIAPTMAAVTDLNAEWDWDSCKKFWKQQLGKTTGVTGVVMLVVGLGVLIVMSSRKKT